QGHPAGSAAQLDGLIQPLPGQMALRFHRPNCLNRRQVLSCLRQPLCPNQPHQAGFLRMASTQVLYRALKLSGTASQADSSLTFLGQPPQADRQGRAQPLGFSNLSRQAQPAVLFQETYRLSMAGKQFGQHKGSFFNPALPFQAFEGLAIELAQEVVNLRAEGQCRSRPRPQRVNREIRPSQRETEP